MLVTANLFTHLPRILSSLSAVHFKPVTHRPEIGVKNRRKNSSRFFEPVQIAVLYSLPIAAAVRKIRYHIGMIHGPKIESSVVWHRFSVQIFMLCGLYELVLISCSVIGRKSVCVHAIGSWSEMSPGLKRKLYSFQLESMWSLPSMITSTLPSSSSRYLHNGQCTASS